MTSVDQESVLAELQPITGAELAPADPETVQDCAIGGRQILENPATISEHESSMLTRHAEVRDHDVARVMPTHKQFARITVPLKCQQRPFLFGPVGSTI
jgi:hypothetical protein